MFKNKKQTNNNNSKNQKYKTWGDLKMQIFGMCLNLNDDQFKTSRYGYGLIYMNPILTANEKPTINTQKLRRKAPKHNTKENIRVMREEAKKRIKE